MRRSVWIFLASIVLPSLGLAWMAVRSVQDQQVVLEHQQVIISQNITDTLAQNIQTHMDQVRDDFVSTTQQLLTANASPQNLAEDFNRKLRDAWPLAEIGFAVNLDGEIYSPRPYDGPEARTFRDENGRFLSNRENVEVYSSNALLVTQNARAQNGGGFLVKKTQTANVNADEAATRQKVTFDLLKNSDKTTTLAVKAAEGGEHFGGANAPGSTPSPTLDGNAVIASNAPVSIDKEAAAGEMSQSAIAAAPMAKSVDTGAAAPQVSGTFALPAPATATSTVATDSSADAKIASKDLNEEKQQVRQASLAVSAPTASAQTMPAAPVAAATGSSASDSLQIASAAPPPGNQVNAAPTHADDAGTTTPDQPTAGQPEPSFAKIARQVVPQKMLTQQDSAPLSNTVPEESDFRRVIGSETSGALARFLENKLRLMVWSHPVDTSIIFGAQLDQARLVEALKTAFQIPELQPDSYGYSRTGRSEYCVAILDDSGQPVAISVPGFKGDWKHPFVATEIGEALPHWEAALYLVDPQQISRAARTLQATLGLIVLVLVAAIVLGGSLIAADVRRQVRLAQQKTDFVSNVSHELKTPLTSIRMFADLLAEKRVPDEQRQSTYLRIISAEAARLTRLINNVLDFARLERGAPPGEHRDCDLVDAVRDVVETCAPHLEAAGIAFQHEIEAETLPIHGDRDALAQIILNLISNAEKYGGNDILVRVRRQDTPTGVLGCVDVLDRGPGIPAGQVKTVFEPFHRLDDSLSSGIPGSGLGLTLARRMARSHGGDVTYSPRAGGGSCFTLTVPVVHPSSSS